MTRIIAGLSLALALILGIGISMMSSNSDAHAQVPLGDDEMVFLNATYNGIQKIVVFHKASKTFLMYGHTSDGLVLQHMRRVDADLALMTKVKELEYSSKGYELRDLENLNKRHANK